MQEDVGDPLDLLLRRHCPLLLIPSGLQEPEGRGVNTISRPVCQDRHGQGRRTTIIGAEKPPDPG